MVETFARGLVNKIMLEAFNNLDSNKTGKRISNSCREEMNDCITDTIPSLQRNEDSYSESEASETVRQMLRGIGDIHIGDWSHVKPVLSLLEKQVKTAVNDIDNIPIGSTVAINEQGDANQTKTPIIVEDSVAEEALTAPINHSAISLLHRMIEELQIEQNDTRPRCFDKEIELNSPTKLDIAAWEEREEECVKIIEGSSSREVEDDALNMSMDAESEKQLCFIGDETAILTSSPLSVVPKSRSFQEIPITDISCSDDNQISLPATSQSLTLDVSSMNEMQLLNSTWPNKARKRALGKRIKNFFLSAFKRKKNRST